MRKVIISGHLAADAELKQFAQSGKNYVTFRMGNSEYFDKDDQGKMKTMWFRVTMFDNLTFANYLKKGKYVEVIGNLREDIYQSKTTGGCEISRDVTADSVSFGNASQNNGTKPTKTEDVPPQVQTSMTPTEKPAVAMTTEEVKKTLPSVNVDEDDLPF